MHAKFKTERHTGGPRRRWKYNIKLDLMELGFEYGK
jgi:hypothetical protein